MDEGKLNTARPIGLAEAKVALGGRRWESVKLLAFENGNVMIVLEGGETFRVRVEGEEVKELFRFLGGPESGK